MSLFNSDDRDYQEHVALYLDRLFRGILDGQKVWDVATDAAHLSGKDWSPALTDDLCKAAKVLAAAWRYPGMVQTFRNVFC